MHTAVSAPIITRGNSATAGAGPFEFDRPPGACADGRDHQGGTDTPCSGQESDSARLVALGSLRTTNLRNDCTRDVSGPHSSLDVLLRIDATSATAATRTTPT